MPVRVDCDYTYDESIQNVLISLHRHAGKIVAFDPTGPGGGNPNLLLDFPSRAKAMAYFVERYPDECREFLASRLQFVPG